MESVLCQGIDPWFAECLAAFDESNPEIQTITVTEVGWKSSGMPGIPYSNHEIGRKRIAKQNIVEDHSGSSCGDLAAKRCKTRFSVAEKRIFFVGAAGIAAFARSQRCRGSATLSLALSVSFCLSPPLTVDCECVIVCYLVALTPSQRRNALLLRKQRGLSLLWISWCWLRCGRRWACLRAAGHVH